MDKILTVNDVAEILSVKPITVREMFREKRLRAFKMGKSWRTTETMLREDIEAMARGVRSQPARSGPNDGESEYREENRPAGKQVLTSGSSKKRGGAGGHASENEQEYGPKKPRTKPRREKEEIDSEQVQFEFADPE